MLGVVDGLGAASGASHEYLLLTGDPDTSYREYGMHGIPRKNMKAIESAVIKSDAMLFPGGSIFQDVTSVASAFYYAGLVKLAKKHGKKVIFMNQGVGPLGTFLGKMQARNAFNAADLIVVRDPQSAQLLRDIGVNKKAHVGADSALLLKEPPKDAGEANFAIGGMKSVAIAPRPFDKKGIDVSVLFGETCRLLFQAGFAPTLIEMDAHEDGAVLDAISKQQGGRIPTLKKLGSPRRVQERLSRMDGVIAMRLHAGILATTVGVPPLMVSYDPKVNAFAKMIDIGNALQIEGLTPQRLFESFQAHYQQTEAKKKVIAKKRDELAAEAMKGIELALTHLK